jgi:HSP20 family molecular chaperone IbpA
VYVARQFSDNPQEKLMSDSGSVRDNPKKTPSANAASGARRKPLAGVDDELKRLFALQIDDTAFSSGKDRDSLPKQVRVERNAYWFEVSMPMRSARKEDIRVEIHGRLLIVSYAPAANGRNGAGTDGQYGRQADEFEDAFMLPKDAIRTDILVSFEDGALTIFVPRTREFDESGPLGR